MTSLTSGGQTRTNAYNGDGTLVAQTVGSVTTRYTQDLASPLSQILSDGTTTSVYGMERLYGVAGSTRTWYGSDGLGSVRQTLNDSGSVLGAQHYDPWGQPQRVTIAPFGFTGELQQGGSVYLRARWYNSGTGTFTARDPFPGMPEVPYSLHQYAYGYSNPVLYGDPLGQFCIALSPNITFGTTCQHDPLLGSFNSTTLVQFAGGFVGRGIESGRSLGEPFTTEGRTTVWRGAQAIRYTPEESWKIISGYYRQQYDLAVLGYQSLRNDPGCTLSLLSASDWGSIGFDVAGTVTGARGLIRGVRGRGAVTSPSARTRVTPLIDPQLDANILIRLLKGEPDIVAYVQANRAAGLSYNTATRAEFLRKGTRAQLRLLEEKYSIRLMREVHPNQINSTASRLQRAFDGTGRKLGDGDARVAATAYLKGERLATGDLQFYKRAKDLGLDVEFVGSGNAAGLAVTYKPNPVVIPPP